MAKAKKSTKKVSKKGKKSTKKADFKCFCGCGSTSRATERRHLQLKGPHLICSRLAVRDKAANAKLSFPYSICRSPTAAHISTIKKKKVRKPHKPPPTPSPPPDVENPNDAPNDALLDDYGPQADEEKMDVDELQVNMENVKADMMRNFKVTVEDIDDSGSEDGIDGEDDDEASDDNEAGIRRDHDEDSDSEHEHDYPDFQAQFNANPAHDGLSAQEILGLEWEALLAQLSMDSFSYSELNFSQI
jgi:hypothetical protein